MMKKLLIYFVSVLFIGACSSEESGKTEKSTDNNRLADTPCDCYEKLRGIMDGLAENENDAALQKEMDEVSQACEDLEKEMGSGNYHAWITVCQRAEGIEQNITGMTACDCKEEISAILDKMEQGEEIGEEFGIIQDKCTLLEAKMGPEIYRTQMDNCQ